MKYKAIFPSIIPFLDMIFIFRALIKYPNVLCIFLPNFVNYSLIFTHSSYIETQTDFDRFSWVVGEGTTEYF